MENYNNNFIGSGNNGNVATITTNPDVTTNTTKPDVTTLHKEFVRLGKERHNITYKLLAILPKIYKLEIYKKYNYGSIYEYACKIAGIQHSIVKKTLKLHKNLRGKPHLQKAVESEGIHKVALVAKLATSNSDAAFADKVKNMSKHSLCELAREVRAKEKVSNSGANDMALFSSPCHTAPNQGVPLASLCHAAPSTIKIELDEEMQFLFLKLKNKLGNHLGNKEVLRKILKEVDCQHKIEQKESQKKEEIRNSHSQKFSRENCEQARFETKLHRSEVENPDVKICEQIFAIGKCGPIEEKIKKENQQGVKRREVAPFRKTKTQKAPTRYIPMHQKRVALAQNAGKCAYPGCSRPAEIFHHTQRFAEVRDHQSVIALCKTHHEFAHNGLIGNEEKSVSQWKLNLETGVNTYTDAMFRQLRRERTRQKT
jgi:hypothetical protein